MMNKFNRVILNTVVVLSASLAFNASAAIIQQVDYPEQFLKAKKAKPVQAEPQTEATELSAKK